MAERFTVPSRDRMECGWASRVDRQRTIHMVMDTSPVHSLAVHELRQPPPRRTHRRGWPRTDWMTPEVWADARWNALSRTMFGVN